MRHRRIVFALERVNRSVLRPRCHRHAAVHAQLHVELGDVIFEDVGLRRFLAKSETKEFDRD